MSDPAGDPAGGDGPARSAAAGRRVPTATYRVQLTAELGFDAAAELVPHLATLGVSHLYLSPVLASAPGSTHGYDVVDPGRIDDELGGAAGFARLRATCRAAGLGLVVDVVPNHVYVGAPQNVNPAWWSLLSEGRAAPAAAWFDVEWDAPGCDGRLVLPILGSPLEECLAADELRLDPAGAPGGSTVLRYHEHVLPVRSGTEHLPMAELVAAQHYRPAWWRDPGQPLNYRRFFDVSELGGVRVEDPEVFAATHRVVVDLVMAGDVDGLRIDHPDGLADPGGYLARLAGATGGVWTVAEKILTGDEAFPPSWACAGTTGYDAAHRLTGLLTDPAGERPLSDLLAHAGVATWPQVRREARQQVAATIQAPEVARLARQLADLVGAGAEGSPSGRPEELAEVVRELLVGLPVYRVYPSEQPVAALAALDTAYRLAADRRPDLAATLGTVRDLVLAGGRPDATAAQRALTARFGQTSAPLTAKGVEDRAFYRWSRLLAHVEVGAEPDRFALSPERFHAWCAERARDWPAAMTSITTHDSKRSADVRARLLVLAELAPQWVRAVTQWQEASRSRGHRPPDQPTALALWQTLVGAWPIRPDRLRPVVVKMLREAAQHTSWRDPEPAYEGQVTGWLDAVLADPELRAQIDRFVRECLLVPGRVNALAYRLLAATMPGVPDTYQGGEGWDLSLIDPDNRRPVDWAARRAALADADRPGLDPLVDLAGDGGGTAAALVLSRALRLRRDVPQAFGPTAGYRPLAADGPAGEHLVGFLRGDRVAVLATRLPVGLAGRGGWEGTTLTLPPGRWVDRLRAGRAVPGGRPTPLADLLGPAPVALLVTGEAA